MTDAGIMKTRARIWSAVSGAFFSLTLPLVVSAQSNPFQQAGNLVGQVSNSAGVGEQKSLTEIVGQIINVALGFLGVVLLAYMLYAGFLWMTAGGSEDGVTKAKTMIRNAIIGLIVIVAAFALSNFVLGSLVNATQG